MSNLIKALQIFLKYGNPDYPTHCMHDELFICGYENIEVTPQDIKELDKLGFFYDNEQSVWKSYQYGSA